MSTITVNICIVEDRLSEVEQLRTYFARYSSDEDITFQITHFDSAEKFLAAYRPVYDIVLLDIGLPSINGMDAAAQLRRMDEVVTIIFVTNMAHFAVRGYEVDAFDFIVKPVTYSNFSLKLRRTLNMLVNRRGTDVLVSTADGVVRIGSAQIWYIAVSDHQLVYHTADGPIVAYGSLKKVEVGLSDKTFVRCNSCYLVNLNYVQAIRGNTVVVAGDELQVSRAKKKDFIKAVNDHLGGGI